MKHWLYDRRTLLLLLAILFGIQLFIFFVYDLNPDALGYMLLLEFVLINIYLVLDYWRHTLSHRFLTAQRKVPDLSWMEFDGTLKDRDYQRIIRQRENCGMNRQNSTAGISSTCRTSTISGFIRTNCRLPP